LETCCTDGDPEVGLVDEGGAEDAPAAVTLAACLEPKIADMMLPKTLISSSLVAASNAAFPASRLR
jgi:hypothetical protein